MGSLDGHRTLVTGGASGIGAAIAERFRREGAAVAVLDRTPVEGGLACDVRDSAAVDAAVAEATNRLGGLTDLVCAAGMGLNKPLQRYSDDDWRLVVDVNLSGAFYCVRAALPHLLDGGGSIVAIGSANGRRPLPGEAPYSAAKAGVANLMMTVAVEAAPRVRANTISPGLIATPLTEMVTSNPEWLAAAESGTPAGRAGTAAEVAALAAFLCSGDAGYITGQDLVIDGGALLPSLQTDSLLRAIMRRSDPAGPR